MATGMPVVVASLLLLFAGSSLAAEPQERPLAKGRRLGCEGASCSQYSFSNRRKVIPSWPKNMPTGVALTREGAHQQKHPFVNFEGKNLPKSYAGTGPFSPQGISYNGGPVMNNPISVYFIWVGSFSQSQKQMMENFVASMSPQSDPKVTVDDWWNTATLYYSGSFSGNVPSGGWVSSSVSIGGEYAAPASLLAQWGITWTKLSGNDVWTILTQSISAAKWAVSSQSAYFVITDITFQQGSSCSSYCGWHTYGTVNGVTVPYGWLGILNCNGFGTTCQIGTPSSVDQGMMSAISLFGHEMAETATDPFLNAWTGSGGEIGDLCAWKFGSQSTWNNLVGTGGSPYLVQLLYNPIQGQCTIGTPIAPTPSPPPSSYTWSPTYGTWGSSYQRSVPTTILCPTAQYVTSFSLVRHRTGNGWVGGNTWTSKLSITCSSGAVLTLDAQPNNPAASTDTLSVSQATGFNGINIASGWAVDNLLDLPGSDSSSDNNKFACPSGQLIAGFYGAAVGYPDGWIVDLKFACSPAQYTWSKTFGTWPSTWSRSAAQVNLCPWHQKATKFAVARHRTGNGWAGGNTWLTYISMTCSSGGVLTLNAQPSNTPQSGDIQSVSNSNGFSNVNIKSGWAVDNLFDLSGSDSATVTNFACSSGQYISGFYGAGVGSPDGWLVDFMFACS